MWVSAAAHLALELRVEVLGHDFRVHAAAWLLFIFIKMGLKLDTLNASSRAYSGFPADVRIPPFTEKLKKGNPSNSNPNP